MPDPQPNDVKTGPSDLADAEEALHRLSMRAQVNRDMALRLAVLFAASREQDFAAFVHPEQRRPAAWAKLRFDLNAFAALMFVVGMALSIAILMSRG
ncbi:MAG: hypothetical protein NW215_04795 [Hyphomicrobiales bacterium]|nr:hypothetical protein [Hyphomicrobiales bacterium]